MRRGAERLLTALRVLEIVHHSPDTILQKGYMEIDDEPKTLVAEPQVAQQLRLEQRVDKGDCLQFKNDLVLNEQVDLITLV